MLVLESASTGFLILSEKRKAILVEFIVGRAFILTMLRLALPKYAPCEELSEANGSGS